MSRMYLDYTEDGGRRLPLHTIQLLYKNIVASQKVVILTPEVYALVRN
jgi:hypothetical protein